MAVACFVFCLIGLQVRNHQLVEQRVFMHCAAGFPLFMQLYGLDYVGIDSFCKATSSPSSPAGYRYAGTGDSCIPIRNFSTLHESFLTVFQLMIGEDLDIIMYQTIALSSEWSFIFFVAWTLVSVWILSNMFLSLREWRHRKTRACRVVPSAPPCLVVMDGFDENDPIMQEQQRKDELRTAAVLVKAALDDSAKLKKVCVFICSFAPLLHKYLHNFWSPRRHQMNRSKRGHCSSLGEPLSHTQRGCGLLPLRRQMRGRTLCSGTFALLVRGPLNAKLCLMLLAL